MQPTIQRRDVLAGVAGGGLVALAGCTGLPTSESGQRDRPTYHAYVPGRDVGGEPGTFFVTLDLATLRDLEGSTANLDEAFPGEVDFDSQQGLADADPLLAYPAVGVFAAALGIAFGLVPYAFGDQVLSGIAGGGGAGDGTETPGETETATSVDTAIMLQGAFVLDGSFDVAELTASVEGFEQTDERDGYTVYEGTGSGDSFIDTEGLAFAASSEAIVALSSSDDATGDPRARLDRVLDTVAGQVARLSDDADADWALRTGGHGVIALGGFGVEPDEASSSGEGSMEVESIFDGADGFVSSLDVTEDTVTGTIAAVFPDGETPDRAEIESSVGTAAEERTIEIDGARVTVTGSWEYDAGTATPTESGS